MDRTGPPPDSLNTYGLTTDRLTIAVPEPADVAGLYQLVGGPDRREVCATLLWDGPDEVADVSARVERTRTEVFADTGFHWVIRDRSEEWPGA